MAIPKVSIIIPTYNRIGLLKKTLESVLCQTYSNWECIIVDDNSPDGTFTRIKDFYRKESRISIFQKPDTIQKGACFSRNYGFTKCDGDFIQWLDDDDLLGKTKLESQVKLLKNQSAEVITVCPWSYLSGEKKLDLKMTSIGDTLTPEEFYKFYRIRDSFFPSHSFLTPRKIYSIIGLWDENLKINQDAEIFSRIVSECRFILIAKYTEVYYRIHSSKRQSNEANNIENLLLSHWKIHLNFKKKRVDARPYLKSRLKKIIRTKLSGNRAIFKKYNLMFEFYGLKLQFYPYYRFRHYMYNKIYPTYVKLKNYKF